jgi:dUTP pyrophosphatase
MSDYEYTMSDFLNSIVEKMPRNSEFAVLKLVFDNNHPGMNEDMRRLYKYHITNHNTQIISERYPNSGFDVLMLEDVVFKVPFQTILVDLGVKMEMFHYNLHLSQYTSAAFHMLPRSSLSKTPLMQSNHVGVIDSGYRGNLKVPLRFLPEEGVPNYTVETKTRLVQVCHPSLCPIYVVLMEENDLSSTSRGSGGFGSTGI